MKQRRTEFFRASVSDVVKTIVAIPSGLSARPSAPDELLTPDGSEFDDFGVTDHKVVQPWDALIEAADNHYYGWEDFIEDHVEALRLYRDAALLGSPKAFERIGDMYQYGDSVREDSQKALEFYKEGSKKGNYFCYGGMTLCFLANGHMANARKSFHKMIAGSQADLSKAYLEFPDQLIVMIERILFRASSCSNGIDHELILLARGHLLQVLDMLRASLDNGMFKHAEVHPGVKQAKLQLVSVLQRWVNGHPTPPPTLP